MHFSSVSTSSKSSFSQTKMAMNFTPNVVQTCLLLLLLVVLYFIYPSMTFLLKPRLFHFYHAPTTMHVITGPAIQNGLLYPVGKWCASSPSCSHCQDINACGHCVMLFKQMNKCRLDCEDYTQPSYIPPTYSFILAFSTAYLILQTKQLLVIWQGSLRNHLTKKQQMNQLDRQCVRRGVEDVDLPSSYKAETGISFQEQLEFFLPSLPLEVSGEILNLLNYRDLLKCHMVSKLWYRKSADNGLWRKLSHELHQSSQLVIKDYKVFFTKWLIHHNAQKRMFQFEEQTLLEERVLNDKISTWQQLNYLRNLASYGSLLSLVWQYLDLVIEAIKWSLCIVLTACIFYRLRGRIQFHYRRFRLPRFLVGTCAIIVLPKTTFQFDCFSQFGKCSNTHALVNIHSILQEFPNISLFRLLISAFFIIRIIFNAIRSSNYTPQNFWNDISWFVGFALCCEWMSWYFNQPKHDDMFREPNGWIFPYLLRLLYEVLTLYAVAALRFAIWAYTISSCVLEYVEIQHVRSRFWQQQQLMLKTFCILFFLELFLYIAGRPSNFLMSYIPAIYSASRLLIFCVIIWRAIMLLSWLWVSNIRWKDQIWNLEKDKLQQALCMFIFLEMLAFFVIGSIPFMNIVKQICRLITELAKYLHWSRGTTLFILIFFMQSDKLPQNCCRSIQYSRMLLLGAMSIFCYDVYYDFFEQMSPLQPVLGTLWLTLWMCF